MRASYRWLVELSGVDASPTDMAARLTGLGLEVEEIAAHGQGLDRVVVAEVRAVEPVAGKDKLRLVTVFDGEGERAVICGAPNVPPPGGRVALALPGAVLPGGFEIATRSVGGVESAGMLCSERELGIGEGHEGILVLDGATPGKPGEALVEALALEDWTFEIGLTPNRPDCLGHVGLAREVALAYGKPFRLASPGVPRRVVSGYDDSGDGTITLTSEDWNGSAVETLTLVGRSPTMPEDVPIRIEAKERCPRYAAALLQGVRVGPSPLWLRHRLHRLGIRSIDNVVDITNYVLLELGHPIHAFDLAKLRGPEIVVRLAKEGERMRTLDGIDRALVPDDLLICDGEGPVALAGVMGGEGSAIGPETAAVLVECAYFDPPGIRRTSRRLGLHTDSSHRFERGVDPNAVPHVVRRTVALLCAHADAAAVPRATDAYPRPIVERPIELEPAHVGRLLGLEVPEAECRRTLEAVGCAISPSEAKGWRVLAPTWRPDLGRPEDLIEEVARARGYDAIPTELPRLRPSGRGVSPRLATARRLREAAAAAGLLEAVGYAFASESDLASARAPNDVIALANPLSEDKSVLRTSLLPGLIANGVRAQNQQVHGLELFELARTYHPDGEAPLPREPLTLGLFLAGTRVDHIGEAGPYDLYDVKGRLESIIEAALGLSLEAELDDSLDTDAPYLHPRRRARVSVAGRAIGVLGALHPEVAESFGLELGAVYAEVEVDALVELVAARGLPQARPLPRFPAAQRDVALVLDEAITAKDAESALRSAGDALVETLELFDVYRGKGIPEGKKSLAFRIVYRDPEATLTDARVDAAHRDLVAAASATLGASTRG